MAYYNTCPICGSNLDPGERCDCRQESNPQEETPKKIISHSAYAARAERMRRPLQMTAGSR